MAAVTLREITKQFGTQVVLEGVSLEIHSGETVGLVGANGAGKTTLFRVITGELAPDTGTVTRQRGLEIGLLKQEPEICLDRTLHDEVGSVFTELLDLEKKLHAVAEEMAAKADDPEGLSELMERYERLNSQFITAGGHTFETSLNEILGGLGFSAQEYHRPMAVLSGGQKCRAALAKLLLEDRTLLLLDEPTNHLDIDAVRWLEKFLAGHHGGSVIISHDRYLLDRVCDRIVEVSAGRVWSFPGNYSNYAQVKDLRDLTQARQLEKDAEFIAKERAFIAKHLAGQRSNEAKGRRTRLERRLKAGEFVTEGPRRRRTVQLEFAAGSPQTGTVVRCDDLSMWYDDRPLFTELTLQIHAGDRLGITGPNGTGKTTLLRLILGQALPRGGSCELDPKRSVGYYSQEHVYADPQRSIVDEVRAARPGMSEEQARSLLGRYLFTKEDAFKPLGALSGGEQSRVRLASLILKSPDVLILDEPTNHLDIPSREVLEEALTGFDGTIIVVSHDRYFLDRIAERLLVIRPEGYALYDGNYSYYIEQIEQRRRAEKERASERRKAEDKTVAKIVAKSNSKSTIYDRMPLEELESLIIERETGLAVMNERFGDPTVLRDAAALTTLREEADKLARELEELNAAWHDRVDRA